MRHCVMLMEFSHYLLSSFLPIRTIRHNQIRNRAFGERKKKNAGTFSKKRLCSEDIYFISKGTLFRREEKCKTYWSVRPAIYDRRYLFTDSSLLNVCSVCSIIGDHRQKMSQIACCTPLYSTMDGRVWADVAKYPGQTSLYASGFPPSISAQYYSKVSI